MTAFSPMILRDGLLENLPATDVLEANLVSNTGTKNLLINGNFDIWQRTVGSNKSITGSILDYTADRWWNNITTASGSPTLNVIRQNFTLGQTDVPGEPEFYLRSTRGGTGTFGVNRFGQVIENVRNGAGQTVTISFWAKADASLTVSSQLIQYFGTGGSPSADVNSATQDNNLTTAWQKFTHTLTLASISGKTIGTNNNSGLILRFNSPLSGSYVVDIAQIQVEVGAIATQFEYRPAIDELSLCQRYYYKTFRQTTVPALGVGNSDGTACCIGCTATVRLASHIHWPVTMRANPSATLLNPISSNSQWRDITNNADRPSGFVATNSSDNGAIPETLTNSAAIDSTNLLHVTAVAEYT